MVRGAEALVLAGHEAFDMDKFLQCHFCFFCVQKKKKRTFFLSVNVFSTKVLIGYTIFTSPTGDGTAIST